MSRKRLSAAQLAHIRAVQAQGVQAASQARSNDAKRSHSPQKDEGTIRIPLSPRKTRSETRFGAPHTAPAPMGSLLAPEHYHSTINSLQALPPLESSSPGYPDVPSTPTPSFFPIESNTFVPTPRQLRPRRLASTAAGSPLSPKKTRRHRVPGLYSRKENLIAPSRSNAPPTTSSSSSQNTATCKRLEQSRNSYKRKYHNLSRKFKRWIGEESSAEESSHECDNADKPSVNITLPQGSNVTAAVVDAVSLPSGGTGLVDLGLSSEAPDSRCWQDHTQALEKEIESLHHEKDAMRKRIARRDKQLKGAEMREADLRVQLAAARKKEVFHMKEKGIITDPTRMLIRRIVALGTPHGKVYDVISAVLDTVNKEYTGSFDPHSTRRIILEGGELSMLQVMQELQDADSFTLSTDGGTHKNIGLEVGFLTYRDNTSTPIPSTSKQPVRRRKRRSSSPTPPPRPRPTHLTRALPIMITTSHTSEAQLATWQARFTMLIDLWNSSPLGRVNPISLAALVGKLVGMLSDHANDQKLLAGLMANWKRQVDRKSRGETAIALMDGAEVLNIFLRYAGQTIADAGGPDAWDALDEDEQRNRQEASRQQAIQDLGEERFQALPQEEKDFAELFLWVGCGMHKIMNVDKWASRFMSDWWTSQEAKALGASPPVKLFNKANAAIIADEAATTSKDFAESTSSGGGVKTTDIAGAIFNNKYEKKGQQDNFRWFFASALGYIIQFPETNYTRFATHGMAATELLVHHDLYVQFLNVIRSAKDSGNFNHMENNLYKAFQDGSTLTELAVMSLGSQAVTLPHISYVRRSTHQNALTLGAYHDSVIAHCQKLANNPDILLSHDVSNPDSWTDLTVDGRPWESPEAIYRIQSLYDAGKLPFLRQLLAAYFRGAVVGWERFTTEFAADGPISQATPRQLDAAFSRTTNDHSEGGIGSYRQVKRHAPATKLPVHNAKYIYKQNDTDRWEKLNLTPDMSKHVRIAGRMKDSREEGIKAMEVHAAYQKKKAVEKEEKRQKLNVKKQQQQAKIEAVTVHLDPQYWRSSLPGSNTTVDAIKTHLRWLRIPSRGVTVPPGWSSLRRGPLLAVLLKVLDGLGPEKTDELNALNLQELVKVDQAIARCTEEAEEMDQEVDLDSEADSDAGWEEIS